MVVLRTCWRATNRSILTTKTISRTLSFVTLISATLSEILVCLEISYSVLTQPLKKVVIASIRFGFVHKWAVLFQKYFCVLTEMAKCYIGIVVPRWRHTISYAWFTKVLSEPIVWTGFGRLIITTWCLVTQERTLHTWVRISHLMRLELFSYLSFRCRNSNIANGTLGLGPSSYGILVPSTVLTHCEEPKGQDYAPLLTG